MWSAVKGTNFTDRSITVGGMNCVLHEPITCSIRFHVLTIKNVGVHAGMSIYLEQYYGNVSYAEKYLGITLL